MRTAAQLTAEARYGNHPYLLAILLAEQRHRAGGDRLIEWHHIRLDLEVLEDLLIHEALDFEQLGLVHLGVVREVEAQAAGIDHAAGLLHMLAEHLPQRGMQQMRSRMIAPGGI